MSKHFDDLCSRNIGLKFRAAENEIYGRSYAKKYEILAWKNIILLVEF